MNDLWRFFKLGFLAKQPKSAKCRRTFKKDKKARVAASVPQTKFELKCKVPLRYLPKGFPELKKVLVGIAAAEYSIHPWRNTNLQPKQLTTIIRKSKKIATHSGEGFALRLLKEALSDLRLAWINDTDPPKSYFLRGIAFSRERCAAWSMVKRAMPFPMKREIKKAILSHRENLTTEFTTSVGDLRSARQYARHWARTFLDGRTVNTLTLSDSACIEYTRKQGGLSTWVRKIVDKTFGKSLFSITRPPFLPRELWQSESASHEVLLHAQNYLVQNANLAPKAKVSPLPEHGMKCRIVTKSEAPLVYAGHLVRRRLMRGLRRTPEVSSLLKGDYKENLERYKGSVGEIASSDLTAASDLLPLDLVSAIVEGLISSGKFSPIEIDAFRLCTGPQLVEWPSEFFPGHDRKAITCRGILMGLPTTWCLLNIIHLWWWKESLKRSHKKVTARGVFSCFGDDALIVAETPVLDHYDKLIADCGGSLSEGKHARSKVRGVFLENLVVFQTKKLRVKPSEINEIPIRNIIQPSRSLPIAFPLTEHFGEKGGEGIQPSPTLGSMYCTVRSKKKGYLFRPANQKERVSAIRKSTIYNRNDRVYSQITGVSVDSALPLKGLLYPEEGVDFGGHPMDRIVGPSWTNIGAVVESLLLDFCPSRIYRVQEFLHSGVRKEFQKRKIPCLPRQLGGSGMVPSERGWEERIEKCASRRVRKSVAVLATNTSVNADYSAFSRVWSTSKQGVPEWVFDEGRAVPKKCGYKFFPNQTTVPPGWFYCGHDAIKESIQFYLEQSSLLGLSGAPFRLSDLVKRTHRTRDELAGQWKSVQPVKGSISTWIKRLKRKETDSCWGHPGIEICHQKGNLGFRVIDYPALLVGMRTQMRKLFISSPGGFGKRLAPTKVPPAQLQAIIPYG